MKNPVGSPRLMPHAAGYWVAHRVQNRCSADNGSRDDSDR